MGIDDKSVPDDVAVPSRVNSKPSLHQRRFERITLILPSWMCSGRSEYFRASSKLCAVMIL